jgi:hypothetical protein
MEACSSDDWESLPSSPAECLAWIEALTDFHEALATEEADLMEADWRIADDLRTISRALRRMGYTPSVQHIPDYVAAKLPGWYDERYDQDDEDDDE